MQFYRSEQLKADWGKQHCDHPEFEKVYFSGAFILNYSCTQCGADFSIAQKMEIEEERKKIIKSNEVFGLKFCLNKTIKNTLL